MKNRVGKLLLWLGVGLLIIVSFIPIWILSHHTAAPVNHTSAKLLTRRLHKALASLLFQLDRRRKSHELRLPHLLRV